MWTHIWSQEDELIADKNDIMNTQQVVKFNIGTS